MDPKMICSDYLMFQDLLKKQRSVDDHIINSLNNSLPTNSFKLTKDPETHCNELHKMLVDAHLTRSNAIKNCILLTADGIRSLRDNNRSEGAVDKSFKSEQRKLRMLQSEINVEEIIKERTFKAFKERCGVFINFQAH